MLGQRVVTAIVLLAVLMGALLAPGAWPLIALLTVAAACALWEWLRLTWPRKSSAGPVVSAVVLAIAMGALAAQWIAPVPAQWAIDIQTLLNYWLMPLASVIWLVAVTILVVRGNTSTNSASAVLSIFAILALMAVWAALVQMFLAHGAWFLVSLLALIWFADIAAYFTGKAFGKRKLAPKVSPGKTWEGALGGVAAATLWVVVSSYWEGSFGFVLRQHWSWPLLIAMVVLLAALSIVGDLFESLLKRRAGVKDSSQLLPGHGGVYDRIDALLPVAPIALLLTGVWL
ncbi:MAG TPA: phosphatidate cytidylyltransferase [Eoetvoesiella sp.]